MATASFDAGAAAAPVWKDKKRYLWMLGLVIPVTPLIGLALQHETGWSGWLWMAKATLAGSPTPWDDFVDDYDRIRDVMAGVFPGFENFNQVVRQTNGFRIAQPARERTFLTPSGRMEFSHAALPDVVPADAETLVLQTMRSHDQWNTTIYSNNDRYRGVKNLRELIFMTPRTWRRAGSSRATSSTSPPPRATARSGTSRATGRSPTTCRAAAPRATCRR